LSLISDGICVCLYDCTAQRTTCCMQHRYLPHPSPKPLTCDPQSHWLHSGSCGSHPCPEPSGLH